MLCTFRSSPVENVRSTSTGQARTTNTSRQQTEASTKTKAKRKLYASMRYQVSRSYCRLVGGMDSIFAIALDLKMFDVSDSHCLAAVSDLNLSATLAELGRSAVAACSAEPTNGRPRKRISILWQRGCVASVAVNELGLAVALGIVAVCCFRTGSSTLAVGSCRALGRGRSEQPVLEGQRLRRPDPAESRITQGFVADRSHGSASRPSTASPVLLGSSSVAPSQG